VAKANETIIPDETTEGTVTPEAIEADPQAVDRRAFSAEPPQELDRPPLVRLLDAIGLKQGATLRRLRTLDGQEYRNVEVVAVFVCREEDGVPGDVVLTVKESGTTVLVRVRYFAVSHFTTA
jgi:hypothetical protein